MGIESTLLIVKPDGVERGLVGEILVRIERKGYRIEKMQGMRITEELAGRHYAEHKGKPFYDELIEYITGGLSVVVLFRGENAIENVRVIIDRRHRERRQPSGIADGAARADERRRADRRDRHVSWSLPDMPFASS